MLINKQSNKGIILVSFEYPPRRLTKMSDKIQQIAKALTKEGRKVYVITFDDWQSDIVEEKNITIIRIPNFVPNNISFFSTIVNLKPAYQSAIAAILNEEEIDIIHFFEWQTLPLLVSWGATLKQKLIASTSSLQFTRDNTPSPYNNGIRKLEELSLQQVDAIIVESESIATGLNENYKIPKEKVKIQPFKDRKLVPKLLEYYSEITKK
ncbi:MAG: glycosyltransferase family 4 protein [Candidatus Heimdallarchaeota archaeon]